MSNVDLDRLDALFAAATPGDWHRDRNSGMKCDVRASGKRRVALTFLGSEASTPAGQRKYKAECDCNAEWIAQSKNAYPALAAELRTLRAERASLRAERDAANDTIAGLREALVEVRSHYPDDYKVRITEIIDSALARTPDQHRDRIVAEGLRDEAGERVNQGEPT